MSVGSAGVSVRVAVRHMPTLTRAGTYQELDRQLSWNFAEAKLFVRTAFKRAAYGRPPSLSGELRYECWRLSLRTIPRIAEPRKADQHHPPGRGFGDATPNNKKLAVVDKL